MVSYIDENGVDRIYTADNSLLVYIYKVGQPLELALNKDRVLINTVPSIYAAPIFLFILGLVPVLLFLSTN